MKVVRVGKRGSDGMAPLDIGTAPDPTAGPGEVVIEVVAAGVNRADLMQREGNYPPPPGASEVLGLEASGVVVEVGDGVDPAWIGRGVCTLLPGGGYASRAVTPEGLLIPVSDTMDLVAAAGIPEVFLTAYSALFDEGRLQSGETVVVHAAASGVGTAAIQLARRAGARVFTTSGGPEKGRACRELGAELAIDRHTQDFEEEIRSHLGDAIPRDHVGPGGPGGPGGVDVIVDMVGRDYIERNLRLLNVLGRLVIVSVLSGAHVEANLMALTSKRATIVGTTLRARRPAEKAALTSAFLARFGDDLVSGAIAPVIDRVVPVDRVEEAHERLAHNRNVGKVLLQFRDDPRPGVR